MLLEHCVQCWVQAMAEPACQSCALFASCRMSAEALGRCSANELQAASSVQCFDYLPNLSKFLTSRFLLPPTSCPSGRHWIWGWNILIGEAALLSMCTTQGSVALFIFPTCLVGGMAKWKASDYESWKKNWVACCLLKFQAFIIKGWNSFAQNGNYVLSLQYSFHCGQNKDLSHSATFFYN